jgi:hypothetical protein
VLHTRDVVTRDGIRRQAYEHDVIPIGRHT